MEIFFRASVKISVLNLVFKNIETETNYSIYEKNSNG